MGLIITTLNFRRNSGPQPRHPSLYFREEMVCLAPRFRNEALIPKKALIK